MLAKSFARIHWSNLINSGILPLEFVNPDDYGFVSQGDRLSLPHVREEISRAGNVTVLNLENGRTFEAKAALSERQRAIILDGGLLLHTKAAAK